MRAKRVLVQAYACARQRVLDSPFNRFALSATGSYPEKRLSEGARCADKNAQGASWAMTDSHTDTFLTRSLVQGASGAMIGSYTSIVGILSLVHGASGHVTHSCFPTVFIRSHVEEASGCKTYSCTYTCSYAYGDMWSTRRLFSHGGPFW